MLKRILRVLVFAGSPERSLGAGLSRLSEFFRKIT